MKPIEPKNDLLDMITSIERKKQYRTENANMKSKIVAMATFGEPAWFVRGDFQKLEDGKWTKDPVEFWHITNPFTEYFDWTRQHIENLKTVIKAEKQNDNETGFNKYRLKETKERYEFMTTPRKINPVEMKEREADGMMVFLRRK